MAEAVILIVDDDRTIVRLCQKLLERASYRAISALDPLDALKILERQKVDLLLSDIRMPVMDGFELIAQAKKFQPDLPVLVMTGFGSIDNALLALHRGVDGLILKPFENSAELIQSVQRVLGESRQKRDAARLQALRPLFDVSEQLLAETSPQPLEKLILSVVTGIFQANFVGIYRIHAVLGDLEMMRTTAMAQSKEIAALQHQLLEIAVADEVPVVINVGGPGYSEAEQVLFKRDLLGQDLFEQDLLRQIGWETLLVAPVRRNNSQFVFCAGRAKGSPPFIEADLEMFVILARQAAVAMENARLYSELKDYVRQVENSQRALIQAEKMAAVGRLVASLAHEINNPLQAVRNCLHLATRKGIDPQQHYHYLKMTDSELERLVTTVRRMLDFYRPGSAEKEKVGIRQIIDQVLALLDPQLRLQGVNIHLQTTGTPIPLWIVPNQIQQVIFNIIINAMDALEEAAVGAAAAAKASDTPMLSPQIWIDVAYEEQQVRVMIEDSGPGIQADLRGQIFEPFVSTKQHGTGLGLAVSYGIMERHQGRLSLISPRYGGGVCFEIALPLGDDREDGKNFNR